MKPVEFPDQNVKIAEKQDEYITLPAHITQSGTAVSLWELSEEEFIEISRTRKLWVIVETFNKPYPPMMIQTENPFNLKNT